MSDINFAENYSKYRKQLEELGADLSKCAQSVVSKMADVGMKTSIKATPVGQYPSQVSFITNDGKIVTFKVHKKIGGTLRRGWKKDATRKEGKDWISGFSNNVAYAIYVNGGHRIVSHGITWGYVPGKRMLEQGQNEAERQAPAIFEAKIAEIKQKGGW
nr:HK97 gp10 family phage protein [uncultured Caproiciproducens sp.]